MSFNKKIRLSADDNKRGIYVSEGSLKEEPPIEFTKSNYEIRFFFCTYTRNNGVCLCQQSGEQKNALNNFFKKTFNCSVMNFMKS
jgi:hypothetical protein